MAMVACNECRKEISNTAKSCPQCGAKAPKTSQSSGWGWGLLFAVIGLFLLCYIIGSSPENKAKSQERDAISICWQQQESRSLDPSTKRFAAKACEMMEQKFRDTYGRNP